MKNPRYTGFTKLTGGPNDVGSKCIVFYHGKRSTFKEFSLVGFRDVKGVGQANLLCVTACDLRDLHHSITTLIQVYKRAMAQADDQTRLDVESDLILGGSLESFEEYFRNDDVQ